MEKLNAAEVAKILGVSTRTVARYCHAGILKAEQEKQGILGRYAWKIDRDSVNQLVEQLRKQQA